MASSLLHAVVGNIPVCYHSSDLRNFFSRFIEKDGFDCFHFRHRPENRNRKMEKTSESYSEGSRQKGNCTLPSTCCVIRLSESQYKDLIDVYDYRRWITETGESMKSSCRIRRIKVDHKTQDKTTEGQYKTRSEQSFISPDREEFNEEDLANLAELHPPTVMPKGNVGTPTLVFWDLIRQCLLPPKIIGKLKLKFPKMGFNKKYGNVPFDYERSEIFVLDEERIELSRLAVKSGTGHELQLEEGLIGGYDRNEDCLDRVKDIEGSADDWELFECGVIKGSNPRQDEGFRGKERKGERSIGGGVMKEGVYIGGTVREADRRLAGDEREGSDDQRGVERGRVDGEGKRDEELEREGKEREIKKKKEERQEFGRRRREETGNRESVERGEMTLGKGMNKKPREAEEIGSRISQSRTQGPEPQKENTKRLADGGIDEAARVQRIRELEKKAAKAKKRRETEARRRKMALRIEEKMIEFERGSDRSEEDADDCEEWERHEALHDDPSNQERNEERLFEQEIELKWEKGGSGLVFYTDAQFWKEHEGDFDEQTADDWDVDMSGYYDPGGGDMDGRDLIRIRRDTRRRDGLEDEDGQVAGIGKFERHTKGIGRKILERQGWKDGKGLGSSASGIAEALKNDGQNPHCKTGFGFQEAKERRKNKMFYRKQEIPTEWHRPIISTIYEDPSITDPMDPLLRRNEPYQLKRRKIQDSL